MPATSVVGKPIPHCAWRTSESDRGATGPAGAGPPGPQPPLTPFDDHHVVGQVGVGRGVEFIRPPSRYASRAPSPASRATRPVFAGDGECRRRHAPEHTARHRSRARGMITLRPADRRNHHITGGPGTVRAKGFCVGDIGRIPAVPLGGGRGHFWPRSQRRRRGGNATSAARRVDDRLGDQFGTFHLHHMPGVLPTTNRDSDPRSAYMPPGGQRGELIGAAATTTRHLRGRGTRSTRRGPQARTEFTSVSSGVFWMIFSTAGPRRWPETGTETGRDQYQFNDDQVMPRPACQPGRTAPTHGTRRPPGCAAPGEDRLR